MHRLLDGMGIQTGQIQTLLDSFDLGQLADFVTSLLGNMLSLLTNLAFVVALVLFMCVDSGSFATQLQGARDRRPAFVEAMESFAAGTRKYFGFLLGLLPPAFLALLEGGPGLMLAVIAAYSVINVVIQSVIQPKIVGDAVGLSASVTFLALVVWAWIIGPLGTVLAIPLTLLAKALLIDVDSDSRWIRGLIGDRRIDTSA